MAAQLVASQEGLSSVSKSVMFNIFQSFQRMKASSELFCLNYFNVKESEEGNGNGTYK
jgi:hypothetical protein